MRFNAPLLSLTSILAALASAQEYPQNPFNIPFGGLNMTVGVPTTLSWVPTTAGTISLLLRDGPNEKLNPGVVIACTFSLSALLQTLNPTSTSLFCRWKRKLGDEEAHFL